VGINIPTVHDLSVPLQMLMTGHVNYSKVTARFNRLSEDIWFSKGMEMMDNSPDPSTGGAAGHHDDAASIANAIEKGLSSRPMSQKDKELDRISSENQARLRIVFAGIAETHGPGSPSKTVLGKITSRGKEFYDCRLETAAACMFSEIIQGECRKSETSSNYFDRSVSIDPAQANLALSTAYRSMNFAVKEDHALYKMQASLVNFATPCRTSYAFTSLTQEGVGLVQKILCEAASKDIIHASKLFLSADISSGPRIIELICNFRCANAGLIQNISDAMVIKYLMEYAQSLASPNGRDYCRKFKTRPQLFVNMFNDIQTIWRVFLELGMQVDCLQLVRNGQSLPVKLFEPAITTARMILNGLITTINRGEMLEYKHIPAAFVFFYPNSRSEPGDPASPPASTPDMSGSRCDLP